MASPLPAPTPAAALLGAAEVYVEQVFRRRNILLRQLQLHVNAYARAELAKQNVSTGPGGLRSPNGAASVAAGSPQHALKASLVRLAQQLRKETVRLIEAMQLVKGAQTRLADTADRAGAAAAAPGVDVDEYLRKALVDTDIIGRSSDLVRCCIAAFTHRPGRCWEGHVT